MASNYEICPISGFKMLPFKHPHSKLRLRWDGQVVRLSSLDSQHPQKFVESRSNQVHRGSVSPEQNDLTYTAITPSDL